MWDIAKLRYVQFLFVYKSLVNSTSLFFLTVHVNIIQQIHSKRQFNLLILQSLKICFKVCERSIKATWKYIQHDLFSKRFTTKILLKKIVWFLSFLFYLHFSNLNIQHFFYMMSIFFFFLDILLTFLPNDFHLCTD